FELPIAAGLLPMTGMTFLLYSFYMLPDPATTPSSIPGQVAFGGAVAAVYGILMFLHIAFGLFFSLAIICAARGLLLHIAAYARRRAERHVERRIPVGATGP